MQALACSVQRRETHALRCTTHMPILFVASRVIELDLFLDFSKPLAYELDHVLSDVCTHLHLDAHAGKEQSHNTAGWPGCWLGVEE